MRMDLLFLMMIYKNGLLTNYYFSDWRPNIKKYVRCYSACLRNVNKYLFTQPLCHGQDVTHDQFLSREKQV